MAKYDNSYIEMLNSNLSEEETRLSILRMYTANFKALGHYSPEPGILRLILGMQIADTEPEIPVAK